MVKLADMNSKVVAITGAMPNGTALDLFQPKHPDKYFDVGIAEEHAVLFAAGMATKGYKPFCAIYSTFLQRAFDQIVHDVCLQNLNVVFCMDRGGLSGDDGPTHHGLFDISYLRCIPNLVHLDADATRTSWPTCFSPRCTTTAPSPSAIRAATAPAWRSRPKPALIPIGKAEVVKHGTQAVDARPRRAVCPWRWKSAKELEAKGFSDRGHQSRARSSRSTATRSRSSRAAPMSS